MRRVYVAGVGMTSFAKQPSRTLKDLTEEATRLALADAEISLSAVGAVYFANAMAGAITGQGMVGGQVALRPMGVQQIPVFNIENACASASTAFHLAWQAVAAGFHDIALAVGVEKMTHPDKERTFQALAGAMDVEAATPVTAGRSPLMEIYAEEARSYMEESGATLDDFAAVVVKNQHNAALNPNAQFGMETTRDAVLEAREIVWPLTLPMCSAVCDGAAATVLVSGRLSSKTPAPVRIAASTVVSGVARGGSDVKGTDIASRAAYDIAGLGPEDIDCAEVHDAVAPAELPIYEELGFALRHEGSELLRSGAVSLSGRLPINTSGGLLGRGHAIGATGIAQIHEVVSQLRGRAGGRQVVGARVGLTQNGGGCLGGDNAAVAVHLFIRDGRR